MPLATKVKEKVLLPIGKHIPSQVLYNLRSLTKYIVDETKCNIEEPHLTKDMIWDEIYWTKRGEGIVGML